MSGYGDISTDPVLFTVTRARVDLLLKQPFFGTMATRLQIILTDNKEHAWCETAATDGRHMWLNRDFVASMTYQELLFVLAHEVLHLVYDTLGRRGSRDPKYYNMASDYIINHSLVLGKVGTMPPVGLYNEKYDSETWTSEEVYDDLKKNQVKIELPLDQHLDGKGGADGAQKKGGQTVTITLNGDGDGPPTLTKEELEEIKEDIRTAAIQAARSALAQSQPGCVPAGVRRLINELDTPKIDWRAMLTETVKSAQKDDYTFLRMSRREMGNWLLPAQDDGKKIEAHASADTSGSITPEQVRIFLSEMKGIMTSFNEFKMTVACWDTGVYNWQEFDQYNLNDIDEYEPQGNGGTDPSAYFERLQESHDPQAHQRIILFTDGYLGGDWGESLNPDPENTLWIIVGNDAQNIKAPYGMTCYYEDAMEPTA